TIDETLHERRHRPPPRGIDEYQVIGPVDELAGPLDIRLAGLLAHRLGLDVAGELETSKIETFDPCAGLPRASSIFVRQCIAETAGARMTDDHEYLHRFLSRIGSAITRLSF